MAVHIFNGYDGSKYIANGKLFDNNSKMKLFAINESKIKLFSINFPLLNLYFRVLLQHIKYRTPTNKTCLKPLITIKQIILLSLILHKIKSKMS